MSKIEVVCPHCHKANALEVAGLSKVVGLQNIQCSHCSKRWDEDLSVTNRLIKSAPAPSAEPAALRVQVRAQMDELLGKINGLLQQRQQREAGPVRFNVNRREVEKSDEVNREFLNKVLANGKPFGAQPAESSSPRFQTVESIGSAQRMRSGTAFDINGAEKSDTADVELRKALGNPKPVGFTPRS